MCDLCNIYRPYKDSHASVCIAGKLRIAHAMANDIPALLLRCRLICWALTETVNDLIECGGARREGDGSPAPVHSRKRLPYARGLAIRELRNARQDCRKHDSNVGWIMCPDLPTPCSHFCPSSSSRPVFDRHQWARCVWEGPAESIYGSSKKRRPRTYAWGCCLECRGLLYGGRPHIVVEGPPLWRRWSRAMPKWGPAVP